MLKPQDIVILLKILASLALSKKYPSGKLSQKELATYLCMSTSEVHAGTKRLILAGLLGRVDYRGYNSGQMGYGTAGYYGGQHATLLLPIKTACEECLISAVKYFFPAQLGEYTRGIATSYASPVFEKHIVIGDDPIPVWPDAEGGQRGLALEPLYRSVPRSLMRFPDPIFYELLALVDAIRSGRARERKIAIELLKERMYAQ